MRIAVVGAGIGGLAAAAGLQGDGHEVTVFEERAEPGEAGAGLTLFSNAFGALDALGLGAAVRAVSSDATAGLPAGVRTPAGRSLLSVPPAAAPPVRSMHRRDLHRVLADALEPGTVRAGEPASVMPDGSPLISAAARTERFDLVVAADGIRSPARTAWGLDRGLRYSGYTAWRGVTGPVPGLLDWAGETWGRGRRVGLVPLPGGRAYWFAAAAEVPSALQFEHRPVPGSTRRPMLSGSPVADPHAAALELFSSWHAPIRDCIAATDPASVSCRDVFELARIPRTFVRGRGVLLGDAAHAMAPDIGQGAGQAIEDAATLVLLLRRMPRQPGGAGPAPGTLDWALSRYDALRRGRTRALWRQARLVGRLAQSSGAAASRLRDAGLRGLPARAVGQGVRAVPSWTAP